MFFSSKKLVAQCHRFAWSLITCGVLAACATTGSNTPPEAVVYSEARSDAKPAVTIVITETTTISE